MKNWLSPDDYDFIFSRVPRPCVDIIIRNSEGILLSLRDILPARGDWHFPGGMIYKDENLETAVKRVAKKETGLNVLITKHLGFMEFLSDGMVLDVPRHSVSFVFETKPLGGELIGDFQSTKLQYFSLMPQKVHPIHKKFLLEKGIF